MSMQSKFKGFSLIEVIAALAIILILTAITLSAFDKQKNAASCKNAAIQAAMQLETLRQKAIALEREAGICVISDREYYTFIGTGIPLGLKEQPFLLCAAVSPDIEILQTVDITREFGNANLRITYPPKDTRIYFTPNTMPAGSNRWRVATPYVGIGSSPHGGGTVMTIRAGNVVKNIGIGRPISTGGIHPDLDDKIYVEN